jgi:hypothetical protein
MPTVSTSSTILDSGTSGYVKLTNAGSVQATIRREPDSTVLWPGSTLVVIPAGVPVTAVTTDAGTSTTVNVVAGANDTSLPGAGMVSWEDLSDAAKAVLSATYVQMVAPPTGVTATDCANFTAALAALPSTGGKLILQERIEGKSYDFTNGVTINKACTVEGKGSAWYEGQAPTRIVLSSLTGNCITITASSVTLTQFEMINTASPTAGCGVRSTGNGCQYIDIKIAGFYNLLDQNNGTINTVCTNGLIQNCKFYNSTGPWDVRYNVNDAQITGNEWARTIYAPANFANLRVEAGALRIGDNKFLPWSPHQDGTGSDGVTCIDFPIPDGALVMDVLIHDNSIEGYGFAGIAVRNTSTGSLVRMQIVDNQFGVDGAPYGIYMKNSGGVWKYFLGIIDGNTFAAASTGVITPTQEIYVENMNQITVGVNNTDARTNVTCAPTLVNCLYAAVSKVEEYPLKPSVRGGVYYTAMVGKTASQVAVVDRLSAVPFTVQSGSRPAFDQIAVSLPAAGGTGSTGRLGIYRDSGYGIPGALLLDAGSVATDVTGARTIAINVTLDAGLYWLAYLDKQVTSAPTLYCPDATTMVSVRGMSAFTSLAVPLASDYIGGYFINGVAGPALPATWAGATNWGWGTPPLVFLRAA